MPPHLLLAPAGHGKTEHLIRRIRQVTAEEPLAPVMVIVPNTIQAGGFRQRLAAAGGALGVEVHTFHTLYAELLSRAGQPMPLLADPLRIHLLRLIVNDLCERGEIRYYATLRDKPGFIAALRNTIEELKRARIFPEDFAASTRGIDPRQEEIALIYSAYQDWLQTQRWADNEGRGWLAAIALEADPGLGTDGRLLAVTGFDEFNPTHLAVLSLLAKRAKETLITLTGDLQRPDRPAHRRFRRAQNALVSSLSIQPEAMDSATLLVPALAHTEKFLFEDHQSSIPSGHDVENQKSEIEFVEAQTRAIEARAALRWLKIRILRDGMRPGEVAVLARDIEPYRPFLEETAAEFGMPLRLVDGQPLNENPAIAAMLSLFSLSEGRQAWPRRDVLETWRSPYFDWSGLGIRPVDAAVLDEISRVGHVTAGLEQWREAIMMWEKRRLVADDEEGDSHLPQGDGNGVLKKFEAFAALLSPPTEATARQYIAFIENLMGDDPVLTPHPPLPISGEGSQGIRTVACARANPATAERDVAALHAFKDVLRGLALAESTLKTGMLEYAAFYADLLGAVEAATYAVPCQTGILAASVLNGRGLAFEAVALLGLAEGEFPHQEREDILLRESDRAVLRDRGLLLESRLRGDEGSLFYQTVTRARQRLLLTRPYLAEDGQSWEASAFWDEMRRLNEGRIPVRVRPEDSLEAAEAASPVEWAQLDRLANIHIQLGVEVLQSRLNRRAAGPFDGDVSELGEILAGRLP